SIAGTLLLVPVMVLLLLGLANLFVFTDRSIPAHYIVIIICMIYNVIGIIILILSLIFSIKNVYKSRQAGQYFVMILLSQYFMQLFYWLGLYLIFDDKQFHHHFEISNEKMAVFVVISILLGII